MSGTIPWERVRRAGSKLTTPLLPDDYLTPGQPAVELARAARPRREGGPGDRGRRHAGDPARLGLALRPPPRPVRRHRRPGRRQVPVALLLGQLRPPHAQAAARSRSRCGRCRRGCSRRTWSTASSRGRIVRLALPEGDFVLPDPPPEKMLFLVGGSGVTPVMAMLRTLDRRGTMPDVVLHYSSPTEERMIFRRELDGPRGEARLAPGAPALHRHRRDARARRPRRPVPGLAGARDLGVRPLADARRDHRALRGGRPRGPAPHRAVLARARRRRRRGRHHHVPQHRQDRRGRRRHDGPRGRRGGRHRDAVRLPDGHLPHLHADPRLRQDPRPAQRRRVRQAERAGADLRAPPPSASARSTSDPSDVVETVRRATSLKPTNERNDDGHLGRQGVHPPHRRGGRAARPRARRASARRSRSRAATRTRRTSTG